MRKQHSSFDGTLKDVFQNDRPTLLGRFTDGAPVKRFLNIDMPKVAQRRPDLLLGIAGWTLIQLELQGQHDKHIGLRMVEYWPFLKRSYPRQRLKQVVLYVGRGKLRMPNRVDEDDLRFGFTVIDIRDIDAAALRATGNIGDLALAILAGGGDKQLPEILRQAARLKGPARERLLAKILILSGLRGLTKKVEWELNHMGVIIDVRKNPVLMKWRREALAEGRAEGRAEGEARILRELLHARFGPLPKWADQRVTKATSDQLERWARKVIAARDLEEVLGDR